MKTYIAEVPRLFAQFDAMDVEEAKIYLKDEAGKLIDTVARIEDISGQAWPTPDEARVSKSKTLKVDIVNTVTTSKNITKATGGVSFLGPGKADIYFNKDICKSLSLSDEAATTKEGFLSFGGYLTNLSVASGKSVLEAQIIK